MTASAGQYARGIAIATYYHTCTITAINSKGPEVPVKLVWRQGKEAPVAMGLNRGTAVIHNNTLYYSQYSTVFSYTIPEDKWSSIDSDQKFFSLAVINHKLTTIGGTVDEYFITDTILCLSESLEWEELLPSMPSARVMPAAVTTPTHLVVAGGSTGISGSGFSTVEVLNLHTLQWASASSSPETLTGHSMILCDEHVYLSAHGRTIFSCSVEELVNSTSRDSVWTTLPDTPKSRTNLATLRGYVLTTDTSTGAIHCYDRSTNSWSVVGEMPPPRYDTLVTVLPSNELMVIEGQDCRLTEIAHVLALPDSRPC